MILLIWRTMGLILLTVIVTIMWVLHKKKKTLFIKYKPRNMKEAERYSKWEKRLNIISIIGLAIVWIFITLPCILDIPYILTNELEEVSGIVTGGSVAGGDSDSMRRIYVEDGQSGREVSFRFYGGKVETGEEIAAKYLPHTKYGYISARK